MKKIIINTPPTLLVNNKEKKTVKKEKKEKKIEKKIENNEKKNDEIEEVENEEIEDNFSFSKPNLEELKLQKDLLDNDGIVQLIDEQGRFSYF
jgi:hypothetical protein